MKDILKLIREEIEIVDRPENRLDYQRFFKETLKERYQIKTAIVRQISNKCFNLVKGLPKDEILDICDELLESDFTYGRFFAFEWAKKLERRLEKSDFVRFEKWLEKYVDNWAACDHLCYGAVGFTIFRFPELSSKTIKWAKSKNKWMRRASAVSLIFPASFQKLLDEVLNTADILLTDEEDIVQKGYGWMLKEASKEFPDEIFAYVMKHKDVMPRTALRYAIEKYRKNKRKKAMGK